MFGVSDFLQKDGAAMFGCFETSQSDIPSIPSRSPLESGADLTVFKAEPFNSRQPDEGELSAASDDVLRCLFSHDSALEQSVPITLLTMSDRYPLIVVPDR